MIRYYNAIILLPDQSLLKGELITDGSVIKYVGKDKKEGLKFEREIDLNGNVIIPAFKNAHTHSAMTFLRSYADDLPLNEWLFNKVFPYEAKLTADDIYVFTKIAILEYLTSGISASFDMYFEPEAYVAANAEYGFRTVLCGAISGEKENVNALEERYNKFNGVSSLISYKLGFHAEYTASEGLLDAVGALAKKYKAPVFMHNSETESETKNCIEKYGKTPTALFESKGIFDYGGGGFHCMYLDDNDMDIFKSKGLYAVTCPASNAKLASGIAPLTKMMQKGIKIAIGTDGPASNNCLDMFREMFLATALQKLQNKDAAALDGAEVLKMATVNGAHALGLYDCDVIAEGKQADLAVIDMHSPNMQPVSNVVKNIVYSGSKSNVVMTVVAGKILYENGKFNVGDDIEKMYADANARKEKIIKG